MVAHMRKRRVVILAVVVVAALVGWIWWAVATQPPSPLVMNAGNGNLQSPLSLDSNAVPYLVQGLKTRDSAFRSAYNRAWPHFPDWLKRSAPAPTSVASARYRCIWLLANLGTTARPAIPELVHVLREDDNANFRAAAASALGLIANGKDQPVVEALEAATKDTDANVRAAGGRVLSRIDPDAAIKAGITNAAAGTSQ